MSAITSVEAGAAPKAGGSGGRLHIEITSLEQRGADEGDGARFRAALQRHQAAQAGAANPLASGAPDSLGGKIAGRATHLAGEIKKDQQYVSKLLEQAARTGDSMQLMKAMMALNDYQIRVQTISKTVSKATSSLEQLTKLQ